MTAEFLQFLDRCPTAWHAAKEAAALLRESGFQELQEADAWDLHEGKSYFFNRGGSSLVAFTMPKQKPERALLMACHTDSPGLRVRPKPEITGAGLTRLSVEVYGAPILASWFNRDLGLAGIIYGIDQEGKVDPALVCIDDPPLILPQLAIHLDREVNTKGFSFNSHEHIRPLFSGKEVSWEQFLRQRAFLSRIDAYDLSLYPIEKAAHCGASGEWIASARLDNLCSLHAILAALREGGSSDALRMVLFWDHEEIGSLSSLGAHTALIDGLLDRIVDDVHRIKARSLCISVDMTHAMHPSYSEKHDEMHTPRLGGGIAIKRHAGGSYATRADVASQLVRLCEEKQIPFGWFVGRSDIPSGSTVGPIMAARSGIATADIGIGCLSMHSARELIAASDYLDLVRFLSAFWQS